MDWSDYTVRLVLDDNVDIEGNLFEIQEKHKNLGEDLNILVAQEREEGGGVTFEGYIKKVYDVQKFITKNSWSYCNHCYSLVRIPPQWRASKTFTTFNSPGY